MSANKIVVFNISWYFCIVENCGNGDVRLVLVGSTSVNNTEGRLEICLNEVWGTVCNDGMNERDPFDRNAARVVCRQLGFPEDSELSVLRASVS